MEAKKHPYGARYTAAACHAVTQGASGIEAHKAGLKAETETPRCYLSTSHGSWRLIFEGLPVCADTTRERAQACAQQFSLKPAAVIWDGDAGEWVGLNR